MTAPTQQQKVIIEASPVDLMAIQAAAGTGKTYVLVERIEWLVSQRVNPASISVVCFSRDAVRQLQKRLKARRLGNVQVLTLHSLCLRLLLKSPDANLHFATPQDLSEIGKRMWFYLTRVLGQDMENVKFSVLNRYLEYLQQALLPADFTDKDLLERGPTSDVLLMNELYSALSERKLTTLNACIGQALLHLGQYPEDINLVLGHCKHLISDEYQDVSAVQHALFQFLAQGRSFTVVGDPAQSVYSFQGAHPEFLLELISKADKTFTLTENFRSPLQLIYLANRALHIKQGTFTPTDLQPTLPAQGQLRIYHFGGTSSPHTLLISQVQRFIDELPEQKPGQIVILVRHNKTALSLAENLVRAGIRVHLSQGQSKKVITDLTRFTLIPLLRGLVSLAEGTLMHVCPLGWILPANGRQPIQLSGDAQALLNLAWKTRRTVADVRNLAQTYPELIAELEYVLSIWQQLEQNLNINIGSVVDYPALLTLAQQLCQKLWPAVEDSEWQFDLDWVTLLNREIVVEDEPLVVLSTIHKAKGGEWPHVILWETRDSAQEVMDIDRQDIDMPLPEPIFGHWRVDLAEEARLRYIALTRSTRDFIVFMAKEASPIARQIFEASNLKTAAQLRRLLSSAPTSWLPEDLQAFKSLLEPSSSMQGYLLNHWPRQIPSYVLQRAADELDKANLTVPQQWMPYLRDTVSKPAALPVQRLPLQKL